MAKHTKSLSNSVISHCVIYTCMYVKRMNWTFVEVIVCKWRLNENVSKIFFWNLLYVPQIMCITIIIIMIIIIPQIKNKFQRKNKTHHQEYYYGKFHTPANQMLALVTTAVP